MAYAGKYVRAPEYASDSDEGDYGDWKVESLVDESENAPFDPDMPSDTDDDETAQNWNQTYPDRQAGAAYESDTDAERFVRRTPQERDEFYERMDHFEKMLKDVRSMLNTHQRYYDVPAGDEELLEEVEGDGMDRNYNTVRPTPFQDGPVHSVRWDNFNGFPKGILPHNKWEAWRKWHENFEIAASLERVFDQSRKAQLLFISIGEEMQSTIRAENILPNWTEPNCYDKLVRRIDKHLKGLTDATAEHKALFSMRQGKDESVMTFYSRLTEKVKLCGYTIEAQEQVVRLQLIEGMSNQAIAKNAHTYGYETNFIVQSATRAEAFGRETTSQSHQADVFAVDRSRDGRRTRWDSRRERGREWDADRRGPSSTKSNTPRAELHRNRPPRTPGRRDLCSRCHYLAHRNEPCPALSRKCNKCGLKGHFAAACRQRSQKHVNDVRQDQLEENDGESDHKEQQVNALSLQDVLIKCSVGNSKPIEFLIDSGADVNVICGKDWDVLQRQAELGTASIETRNCLSRTNVRSYASTEPMKVEHAVNAAVHVVGNEGLHKRSPISADFIIVRNGRRSLLGRSTASDLGLLAVGLSVSNCEQIPENKIFPKVPGVMVKFSIDRTVPPVRNAYFNVPAAFREAARKRLAEMEEQDIIEKVTTAPDWISGMSAVPKGKNDFRLVVNMRAANKAIKREYFRMPLIDDMKIKLHGAKYFSKLDLSNAFYHFELSPESRDLTTFLSEGGMFRFKRLMFGVNCAPEVFQREMTQILKDVEKHIVVYIDDILVFARTLEELRKTVATVLQILRKHNLTLNLKKCEFDKTQVKFLGHEVDEDGFHVDREKVRSIENFRSPSTASELRSFLGLASFISPYIQHFADITASLWTVATTNTWKWGIEQQRDFEAVKKKIASCVTSLGYFAEHDKTILYTDASPNALGAVLVQEDNKGMPRVISFASKALTSTEKRYAQNQREALGAVWGVEHFSYFLLGRHFTLRTDAQGVAFMLNRTRENSKRALTRADGWVLRLSPYSYDIEYIRGRDNIADPSSRLYMANDEPFNEACSPWEIASIESNSWTGFLTEDEVKEATAKDTVLQQVIVALEDGCWPDCETIRKYQSVSEDLTVLNGIVVKKGCAVIPEPLRRKALAVAHRGHPMAAKMKSILRERVWWPGITVAVEEWVESCQACATTGRPEKPTPMRRAFAPKSAWDMIALDFNGPYARLGGISILVVVDYRSRYLIARPVKSTSFGHTKQVLDNIFEREGYPQNIKSDNGPPFNSEDYKMYCKERGINAVFSTPFFPQQNGLVEGYMKLVNKAMATALSTGTNYIEELQAAVDAHNAAAHTVTKIPPEEALMGRKIRRRLPLLIGGNSKHDADLVDARDRQAKLRAKEYEDARRGARACRVRPGDVVITERMTRLKGDTRFDPTKFTVLEEDNGSLVLCDDDGKTLRRHVTQTRKVKEWRKAGTTVENTPDEEEVARRPNRNRKPPAYLDSYIRLCEREDLERSTYK